MRLSDDSPKLDYARPRRRISPQSLNRWGWLGVFGGLLEGMVGFSLAVRLDDQPTTGVHWAAEPLAGLLMIGGAAMCITGIVIIAFAASRPEQRR
ncbi:MAG TPA: hypothetical protein VGR35_04330 [Tepidisphaeraceae bacterium]|nr:hypothetical protein [Tepidisphaeraceae bacterium]